MKWYEFIFAGESNDAIRAMTRISFWFFLIFAMFIMLVMFLVTVNFAMVQMLLR